MQSDGGTTQTVVERRLTALFVTERGERHQHAARAAAPDWLDIVMLRGASKGDIVARLPDVDFLISERTGAVDAEMIAAGRRLRLVQRLGSQTWDLDLAAAQRAGIPVCRLPIRSCVMVAEHTVMLILALARRVRELFAITDEAGDWGAPPRRCNEDYFAYNWSRRDRLGGLAGATVGIVGLGEIGLELAQRLKPFGARVLYAKRRRLPPQVEAEYGLTHATPDELARESDTVVCLLPNLPENNQSVGDPFFEMMKPCALFVHCGAPGTVNEDALIRALRADHLGGAAIDCFTYEPLRPDDPLLALSRDPRSNLLLTPHVAAGVVSASSQERVGDFVNLAAIVEGRPLVHRIA